MKVYIALIWATILSIKCNISDGRADNWLVRSVALDSYNTGLGYLMKQDISSALSCFSSSYELFPSFLACEKVGWIYENLGLISESTNWYGKCIAIDFTGIASRIRSGNAAYQYRDYPNALENVNQALLSYPHSVEALFLKGVILQNMGDIQAAAEYYYQGTEANPLEIKCTLNLAALHHKYGSVNDALFFYQMALTRVKVFMNTTQDLNRNYLMVKSNIAAAYLQLGALPKAYSEIVELVALLRVETALHCDPPSTSGSGGRLVSCDEVARTISSSLGVQMIIQRTSALWVRWEETVHTVLRDTLKLIARGLDFEGPLLPFDTLLTVMSLEERLTIARSASALIARGRSELSTDRFAWPVSRKLKIGFISFDFNNHPTAHLVEGIFSIIRRKRGSNSFSNRFDKVELFIYSYGKDDNSTYRQQLVALSDHFVELSQLSHREAAEVIHKDQVDILLDMQLHTLGHRLEITAHRPAPIQINYLVYPGTSGATFMNYIIADHVVTPVEHARYYSESLLLLPPTYQVSFFDRLTHLVDPATVGMSLQDRRKHLRRVHGLPDGPNDVIFCNFNKIDKIDPQSFALWMSILRSVPHSYLWLLEPAEVSSSSVVDKTSINDLLERDSRAASLQNNQVRQNLVSNALALGVKESQLLFASRTDKASHIFRHAAADLFLDTLVYGAHSTATDAMRGGLPVLTVLGDTFPSRVAPSLYASLSESSYEGSTLRNTLVVHTLREFEDFAVHLTSQHSLSNLWRLKTCLSRVVEQSLGLFDTYNAVDTFVRGMMALQEGQRIAIKTKKSGDYHVIVTNKIQ